MPPEPEGLLPSRTELLAEAGLDEASLTELQEYGLLRPATAATSTGTR
jgi:hypothetical protein